MIDEHDAIIALGNIAILQEKEAKEAKVSKERIKIDKLKEYFTEIQDNRECKSEICKKVYKNKHNEINVAKLLIEAKEELGSAENDDRLNIKEDESNIQEYEVDLTNKVITSVDQLKSLVYITPKAIKRQYDKKRYKFFQLYKWGEISLQELSDKLKQCDDEEAIRINNVLQGKGIPSMELMTSPKDARLIDLYYTLKAKREKQKTLQKKKLPETQIQKNESNPLKRAFSVVRNTIKHGINGISKFLGSLARCILQ